MKSTLVIFFGVLVCLTQASFHPRFNKDNQSLLNDFDVFANNSQQHNYDHEPSHYNKTEQNFNKTEFALCKDKYDAELKEIENNFTNCLNSSSPQLCFEQVNEAAQNQSIIIAQKINECIKSHSNSSNVNETLDHPNWHGPKNNTSHSNNHHHSQGSAIRECKHRHAPALESIRANLTEAIKNCRNSSSSEKKECIHNAHSEARNATNNVLDKIRNCIQATIQCRKQHSSEVSAIFRNLKHELINCRNATSHADCVREAHDQARNATRQSEDKLHECIAEGKANSTVIAHKHINLNLIQECNHQHSSEFTEIKQHFKDATKNCSNSENRAKCFFDAVKEAKELTQVVIKEIIQCAKSSEENY